MIPAKQFMICGVLFAGALLANPGQETPGVREYSGAKNPEMIPFDSALGELYSRVADGPRASPSKDRIAVLKAGGLSEDEASSVVSQASVFMSAFAAMQQRAASLKASNASAEARRSLFEKDAPALQRLFDETRANIQQNIGAEGWLKINQIVEKTVKPTMTWVGPVKK